MKIYSIFNSIDGEVSHPCQGHFSTFIRFSGCNLRCHYCDTKKAWDMHVGKEMTVKQVVKNVKEIGCKKVTITGGEPLMQEEAVMAVADELSFAQGCTVTVETNGSRPIPFPANINGPVHSWIVDYKTDSSGMNCRMSLAAFQSLNHRDWVKFVISDKNDYEQAKDFMQSTFHNFIVKPRFAFSPVAGTPPAQLVKWLQDDKLFDVVVNLQLHKYIWPNIGDVEV